jgi:mono/diheme cytochrome c family protein
MIELILIFIGIFMQFVLAESDMGFVQVSEAAVAESAPFNQELYDQGMNEYLSAYCGSCHVLDAAGARGNFGPGHNQAATQARAGLNDPDYGGEAKTVSEYLRESIVNPGAYYTEGYGGSTHAMPAYTNLTDEQLEAIVYMLAQQG